MSYTDYQKLLPEWPRFGVITDGQDFADRVTLTVAVKAADADALTTRVRELTAGRCTPEVTGERYDYR